MAYCKPGYIRLHFYFARGFSLYFCKWKPYLTLYLFLVLFRSDLHSHVFMNNPEICETKMYLHEQIVRLSYAAAVDVFLKQTTTVWLSTNLKDFLIMTVKDHN